MEHHRKWVNYFLGVRLDPESEAKRVQQLKLRSKDQDVDGAGKGASVYHLKQGYDRATWILGIYPVSSTSKISWLTGVRISYPSRVTRRVFSRPTDPSPGKTILGSMASTIPSSRG